MQYLIDSEQAKLIDDYAINNLNIPSIILMENAARSAADIIAMYISKTSKILVLCGLGNNGGDGHAIARHLYNNSYCNIEIIVVGDIKKATIDNNINHRINKSMCLTINYINSKDDLNKLDNKYDVVIDALVGIGGNHILKGILPQLIAIINRFEAIKFAIDISTGLNCNNGYSDVNSFVANHTITMFSPKIGLYINEGPKISGIIHNAYLGVSNQIIKTYSNNYILEESDIQVLKPKRKKVSSKFDFGRILIIGGSDKYSGAAALTSNACIKSGVGLVELFSTKFHTALLPEIIQIRALSNSSGNLAYNNIDFLNTIISNYNVLVIGPGLSNDNESISLVKELIYNNLNKKIIIDADGLRAIELGRKLSKNIIITPHIFEFINTFQLNKNDVLSNPYHFAKLISIEYECIVLLKYIPTIITNGSESYYNIGGNNGMSTAGAGDVLSGIIAYFAAHYDSLLLAGSMGALIHSLVGDIYASRYNVESLTASDLINHLKDVDFE